MITESTARCPDCGSPAVITMTIKPVDGSIPIGRSKIGMTVETTHTVVCDHADACPRPEIEDNNCDPWFRNPFSRAAAAEQEAERRENSPFNRKALLGVPWTPGISPKVGDTVIMFGEPKVISDVTVAG